MSSIPKTTLLLATLTGTALLGSAGARTQEADIELQDQMIRRAQWHIEHDEAEFALRLLEGALEDNRSLWTAQFLRGMALGQLGDEKGALDAFLTADDLNPGVADVYFWAGIASFGIGDYDTCWEQTILAHQAGRNMTLEIEQLKEVADPPRNLKERLSAPRAFVAEMNTAAREQDTGLDTALMLGQAELLIVQQQLGRALRNAPGFGLVRARELAEYVIELSVSNYGNAISADAASDLDKLATEAVDPEMIVPSVNSNMNMNDMEEPFTHQLEGHLELLRVDTGAVAYSVPLSIDDISSMSDVTRELRRYVGYLERWARDAD